MDLNITERLLGAEETLDSDAPADVIDAAVRRAWATSEPRLLLVQVGSSQTHHNILDRLQPYLLAAGASTLDVSADVVGLDGPYGPIVRALTSIVPQISTLQGQIGASIRHRLRQNVGPLGQLVVALCPALEPFVSTSTPIEELPSGFAKERFETLMVRLFAALAPAERPMVLFLRNADAADAATLRVLSRILSHTETRQFVVVATANTRRKPRAEKAWSAFCGPGKHIVERFNFGAQSAERTDDAPASGTYATQFPLDVRTALGAAACAGQVADAACIAAALETSVSSVEERLAPAIEAGVVGRGQASFEFADSDQLREWHDLMGSRTAGTMHLRIGQWLTQSPQFEASAHQRFVAAAHLRYAVESGAHDSLDNTERARLADVMLEASKQAISLAAYDVADELVTNAARMMAQDGDVWSSLDEELAERIEFTRFECACGEVDRARAEQSMARLRTHVEQAPQMAAAERGFVDLLARCGAFVDAMQFAAQTLAPLGVQLPIEASQAALDEAFARVWEALGERAIEELAELEPMTNPNALAATRMLFAVHPCAQAMGPKSADLVACRLTELGLSYGNADATSVGYASFGAAIIGRNKDHRTGYRFGKVATTLCKVRGTNRHLTAVNMKFAAAMSIWTHPLQSSIEQCSRTYETALLCGDARAACRLAAMIALLTLLEGRSLDDVAEEAMRQRRAIRSQGIDDEGMGELCEGIERFVGHQKGRHLPHKPLPQSSKTLRIGHLACHVLDIMAHVIGQEFEEAQSEAAELRQRVLSVGAQLIVPEYLFWSTLAMTLPRTSGCPEGLDEIISDFERWADRCPQTFQHKHALLVAERHRLQGLDLNAMRAYDQAISEARENGFSHLESVASEAATRFYAGRDFPMITATYFRNARNGYARWNAHHKIMQLDRRFAKQNGNAESGSIAPPSIRQSGDIDMFTAIKTAQAVSKEIVLQRLLVTLMRIILEHGGAERCHVLLERDDGELNHAGKAIATAKGTDIEVPGPVAKHLGDILPASIIEHVRRTHESMNIEDAAIDREWADDPYIANTRPRSILCFPITRQDHLVGMFYLENNTARAAFTPRRLALLEFLATQASISLEHAKLYADLARENAERSRAEQILRKSEQTLRDKLDIIERQKNDIRTLSTPLLDVADNIVAMPILGELDEERASRVMDILLDTVSKRSVRWAIIDLTGVSGIGESTAEQIGRIVRAVELVGAHAIIAGIRADVARAIVSLDIGLGQLETCASMKDALRRIRNRRHESNLRVKPSR